MLTASAALATAKENASNATGSRLAVATRCFCDSLLSTTPDSLDDLVHGCFDDHNDSDQSDYDTRISDVGIADESKPGNPDRSKGVPDNSSYHDLTSFRFAVLRRHLNDDAVRSRYARPDSCGFVLAGHSLVDRNAHAYPVFSGRQGSEG